MMRPSDAQIRRPEQCLPLCMECGGPAAAFYSGAEGEEGDDQQAFVCGDFRAFDTRDVSHGFRNSDVSAFLRRAARWKAAAVPPHSINAAASGLAASHAWDRWIFDEGPVHESADGPSAIGLDALNRLRVPTLVDDPIGRRYEVMTAGEVAEESENFSRRGQCDGRSHDSCNGNRATHAPAHSADTAP